MTESVSDLIHKWNEQRLDLFAISQPNSDTGEFHGVIRFYHKENGSKVSFLCPKWVGLAPNGLGWEYFWTTKTGPGRESCNKMHSCFINSINARCHWDTQRKISLRSVGNSGSSWNKLINTIRTLDFKPFNPYLVHFGNIQERHLWKKIQNLLFDLWWRHTWSIINDVT